MPNNGNNYRIRREFDHFLRDLPGFEITRSESENFINVRINPAYDSNSSYFSRCCFRWSHDKPHYIIQQLFEELENYSYLNEFNELNERALNELNGIGKIFRKYFLSLKNVDLQCAYYTWTPGIIAGLLIILHLSLLLFPPSRILVYSSIVIDLYALGFWLFSVCSSSQYEIILDDAENQLIEKINFLKSLSSPIRQAAHSYSESSESLPPPYEAVEMGSIDSPTFVPNFFVFPALNNVSCDSIDRNCTDPRQGRDYSYNY